MDHVLKALVLPLLPSVTRLLGLAVRSAPSFDKRFDKSVLTTIAQLYHVIVGQIGTFRTISPNQAKENGKTFIYVVLVNCN